ncbi:MAG: K(+)-insensitive pyrophosphate-energized proton pump [Lacunisphaera sp.]|nr:K(+)-insensitive pyrophosphate-energized proton pump [Lacunisphaera sp.]
MEPGLKHTLGAIIFVIACVFVYRSFYGMRIPLNSKDADVAPHQMQKG